MIKRLQLDFALKRLFKGKALVIYGPRQGRQTSCNMLLEELGRKYCV
ncbi:MAG: hypothetical protein U5L96_17520 [Owenweeksia sp.]|nr:hypothetical protein [Owenweeksia sp.]